MAFLSVTLPHSRLYTVVTWASSILTVLRERLLPAVPGLLIDLAGIVVAFGGALLLRYGGPPPSSIQTGLVCTVPVLAAIKLAIFLAWDLYRGVWAHAGTPEAVRGVAASSTASVGVVVGTALLPGVAPLSVALALLDWMLATAAVGGRRLCPRALRHYQNRQNPPERCLLIAGADTEGVFALRCLRQQLPPSCSVVGFLDPASAGLHVQGLPVVASLDGLPADVLVVPTNRSHSSPPTTEQEALLDDCKDMDISCFWMATTLAPFQFESTETDAAPSPGATATPDESASAIGRH